MTRPPTPTRSLGGSAPPRLRPALTWATRLAVYGLVIWTLKGLSLALAGAGMLALELLLRRRSPARRFTLRFTREGRYLVALTLGVGFAAINTGNNLLYLFLGMQLSMIIVSGVLSEQTLLNLRVTRQLPRQVYAGRPFLTHITLHNDKRHLPSFSVHVEDLACEGPGAKRCYFLKVPAGAQQQTSYRTEFTRRGRREYTGLRLGTRFPFAFFVKRRHLPAPDELVVLPRILPLARLPVAAQAMLGPRRQPRRGQGREFHGLRDYAPGDDARDIHWKRSARADRLVLREYEQERGRSVTVLLNDRRPPASADPEVDERELDDCVDLTASLLVHLSNRGLAVQLRVADTRLLIQPDGRGLNRALRRLALLDFVDGGPKLASPAHGGERWLLVSHRRASHGGAGYQHVFEPGA